MGSCNMIARRGFSNTEMKSKFCNSMIDEFRKTGDVNLVNLSRFRVNLEDYQIIEYLGKSNATVARVRNKKTSEEFAMKIMLVKNRTPEEITSLTKEIKVLALCNHPHIISFHGFHLSNDKLNILMEMSNINLEQLLNMYYEEKRDECFPQIYIKKIFLSILSALAYLWDNFKIVHRDLKPQNIVLDINLSKIKIIDFGSADMLYITSGEAQIEAGTLSYMAPENLEAYYKFRENSRNGVAQGSPLSYLNPRKCDTFGLALIMLRCVLPKINPTGFRAVLGELNQNEKSVKTIINEIAEYLPKDLLETLKKMADFNASERPTINQIWEIYKDQYEENFPRKNCINSLIKSDSVNRTPNEPRTKSISPIKSQTLTIESKETLNSIKTATNLENVQKIVFDAKINESDDPIKSLGLLLIKTFNLTILQLNLSSEVINQKIKMEDIKFLGDIFPKLKALEELEINFSRQKLGKNISHILKGLVECRGLTKLSMHLDQTELEDVGAISLSNVLYNFKNMVSLTLNLESNCITSTATNMLGKSFAQLQNMKELNIDLNDNNLGDEGLVLIIKSLAQAISLDSLGLNMGGCKITKESLDLIAGSLCSQLNLRSLFISARCSKIGDSDVQKLSTALFHLEGLEKLYLDFNDCEMGFEGAKLLIGSVINMGNLETLTIILKEKETSDNIPALKNQLMNHLPNLNYVEILA